MRALDLFLLSILALAPAAHAADKAGCHDPQWARRLPGFELTSCETRDWASIDVSLEAGERVIDGRRTTYEYELKDESKNPTAKTARDHYLAGAEHAGAKLASAADDGWSAALEKRTPNGTVWYVYKHGGGNESSTSSYTVITLEEKPLQQVVEARPIPGPLDVSGKKCGDPAWLVRAFPGTKATSCEAKVWDRVSEYLTTGSRDLDGARRTVNYEVPEGHEALYPKQVALNFVNALKKTGATLMSDPKAVNRAVLEEKTATGDFWIRYEQAGGNDDETRGYSLTTIQIGPPRQEVEVRPMKGALDTSGCKDPQWLVKQFPFFKRDHCKNRDFDSIKISLPQGETTLAGHIVEAVYALTDEKKNPTALLVQQNYLHAMEQLGAKIVSDPKDVNAVVATEKRADGELWYLYQHGSGSDESTVSYSLTTVQIGGPPTKTCKVEVYGVNFDFDKATLRPDSEPVLKQVLAMFKQEPKLSAEIGGHTDDVGKAGYNLKLSGERAQAVKAWLVAHGVSASRLTTHGYGDTKPLVPNSSDENRAKNRRVELKKANCR